MVVENPRRLSFYFRLGKTMDQEHGVVLTLENPAFRHPDANGRGGEDGLLELAGLPEFLLGLLPGGDVSNHPDEVMGAGTCKSIYSSEYRLDRFSYRNFNLKFRSTKFTVRYGQ